MRSILPDMDTRMGSISTDLTPGHSETDLKWAITSTEAILLHLPSQDPAWAMRCCKRADVDEKWHLIRTKSVFALAEEANCSQISAGTVMLLCSPEANVISGRTDMQVKETSKHHKFCCIKERGVRIYNTCACTQERERAGQGSHYCSGVLYIIDSLPLKSVL